LNITRTATALVLSATAAAAQPAATPTLGPLVIRGGVDLVQVDTVVTDGKGRHVTDLKAEDFEILEDGRPQRVTHCEYISTETDQAVPTPVPGAPLKREDVKRSMAIVVDDLSLAIEDVHTLRDGLRKFVDELGPGDLVAVVRTSGGMGILQQFTTDKEVLRAAVGQIRYNGFSSAGMTAAETAASTKIGADAEAAGVIQAVPELDAMARSTAGLRQQGLIMGALGALEYVVEGLRLLPGRKSVMFFSSNVSVRDAFEPGGDGELQQTSQEMSGGVASALRRLANLANRASVVLYTVDPRGIEVIHTTVSATGRISSGAGAYMRNRQETQAGLQALADETGGLFLRNSNDLAYTAREIATHQKGYYLVGYVPDEAAAAAHRPDDFHHIEVKVKRSGLKIKSRKAYQGNLDADVASAPTSSDSMLSAAVSPFAPSDVALQLTPVLLRDAKDGYLVRSFLHVDGSGLSFGEPTADGVRTASLHLLTAAFGDNGVVVDQVTRELPLRVPKQYLDHLKKAGLIVEINLPVRKAGIYQIRAVVRDPVTGRQGSARQFLAVPQRKKDRLALSGVVLTGAPKGSGSPLDEDPNASHAVRRFTPGSDVVFGFMVYEAKGTETSKPNVETTLRLYRENQLVSTTKVDTLVAPAPPPAPRPAKGQKKAREEPAGQALLGSFHLSDAIEPGEYLVEVSALDPAAKPPHHVAAQRVGFEVMARGGAGTP